MFGNSILARLVFSWCKHIGHTTMGDLCVLSINLYCVLSKIQTVPLYFIIVAPQSYNSIVSPQKLHFQDFLFISNLKNLWAGEESNLQCFLCGGFTGPCLQPFGTPALFNEYNFGIEPKTNRIFTNH